MRPWNVGDYSDKWNCHSERSEESAFRAAQAKRGAPNDGML